MMKIPYGHRDGSESKEKGRLSEREREYERTSRKKVGYEFTKRE